MSCYICDKETLETVLRAWMMFDETRGRDDNGIKEAWRDIIEANYEAVHDRYGDEIPSNLMDDYPVPFTLTEWYIDHNKPNKLARYKALKEYMYQCAEGDYHKRPGYYKSRWCLDEMLDNYIVDEFGEE